MSVHPCLHHDGHDAARRAGSSATAETSLVSTRLSKIPRLVELYNLKATGCQSQSNGLVFVCLFVYVSQDGVVSKWLNKLS